MEIFCHLAKFSFLAFIEFITSDIFLFLSHLLGSTFTHKFMNSNNLRAHFERDKMRPWALTGPDSRSRREVLVHTAHFFIANKQSDLFSSALIGGLGEAQNTSRCNFGHTGVYRKHPYFFDKICPESTETPPYFF